MTEQTIPVDYKVLQYRRAASGIRIHGILAIIFGILGTVFGAFITSAIAVGNFSEVSSGSVHNLDASFYIAAFIIFALVILPHIYLVVSGTYLLRQPTPKLVKVLVIINLIIGVLWNLIILVIAIINLTQLSDYTRGYQPKAIEQ